MIVPPATDAAREGWSSFTGEEKPLLPRELGDDADNTDPMNIIGR